MGKRARQAKSSSPYRPMAVRKSDLTAELPAANDTTQSKAAQALICAAQTAGPLYSLEKLVE